MRPTGSFEPQLDISASLLQYACMAGFVLQERETALDGILADLLEEFVDEGFDRKTRMGMADRPPPERRDRRASRYAAVTFRLGIA
jgi:hypothetical protein